MCKSNSLSLAKKDEPCKNNNSPDPQSDIRQKRRGKRDKRPIVSLQRKHAEQEKAVNKKKVQYRLVKKSETKLRKKHQNDEPSGGIESLLPSFIALAVIACGFAAKMGFRGRANVAGIDLGTTNSVVCVQEQSKGVGKIECISDPLTNSPIIPSVISFLDPHDTNTVNIFKKDDKPTSFQLNPHPSQVIVGSAAKLRIDTHPHHTLYNAKRVLGRPCTDNAINELTQEVEYEVSCLSTKHTTTDGEEENNDNSDNIIFRVPFHSTDPKTHKSIDHVSLQPQNVGSYIINHLMEITRDYLKHDNVQSAVIAIPAKFDQFQRAATVQAFKNAGVSVARVLEEPVAAALAYGLQKKDGVNYIMVYDFGGGTLDVSILHVSDGGYVEVMGNDGNNSLGGVDFDVAVAHSLLETNGGEAIVTRVGNVIKEIEQKLLEGGVEEDLEELLASQCPRLEHLPVCTISSFHTIGEKMKISLSSFPDGGGSVQSSCYGLPQGMDATPGTISDLCSMLEPVELTFTSAQYNDACKHLYERSMLPIRRILEDLNLETDEIDEVVMVGGTTRMPQIQDLVKKELDVKSLNTHIDPDLTVAYGAASVID